MLQTNLTKPSWTAQIIGYAGLIPFVCLSLMSFLVQGAHQSAILFSLLSYGATIISFLGAIYWGLSMREKTQDRLAIIWSVIPSLLAWCSLIFDTSWGLAIQFLTIWTCLFVDYKLYPQFGMSQWLGMRLNLTLISGTCIAITVGVQVI